MALFTRRKQPTVRDVPPEAASVTPTDNGDPVPSGDPALEQAIARIGGEFLDRARRRRAGVLSSAFWSDKLMDWAMKDEAFKVQLFRFVDAFPRLTTPEQVHDHLVDYLSQPGVTLPPGMGVGLKAGGVLKGTLTKTVTGKIRSMAEKFIAGTDATSALPLLRKLWDRGYAFSVDLLGESCVSQAEATQYQAKYLDLVQNLPEVVGSWPADERLETDHLGAIPRTNVSIKVSSLRAGLNPLAADVAIDALVETLTPILEAARDANVLINFDMEQHEHKDLTLDLFMRCCEMIDFPAGLAMQAYLRSGDEDARRVIAWAEAAGRQITVRLVKGAYWDYETINAEQRTWPVPVWSRKADTDACFERMSRQFIEATPRDTGVGGVKLALGSHNARSIAYALAVAERQDLPKEAIEIQMLHGMGDPLKAAAKDLGLRLREYVPVGEMIPGMAYLVRRLLENTSNESWLRAGFSDEADPAVLLASPHRRYRAADPGPERLRRAPERHALTPAVVGVGNERPFMNEPRRDFAQRTVREAFGRAVEAARTPEPPPEATEADAERVLAAADAARSEWRSRPVRARAGVLEHAADLMRTRRDHLAGLIVREAGKTWTDADAEVCEAIDFCTYYARTAVGLFELRRLGRFAGEQNLVTFEPRGVAVVITPWSVPLAVPCGLAAAALVTGNPTIVKPAGAARGVARVLHELLREAGVPDDVVQLLAGPGRTVGATLVRDRRTALVAFAGSPEVGRDVLAAASRMAEGQRHVKKVVSAMGGRNAIIVDASADLDEAVLGVRAAAFGYQGQKSSACARAIVVDSVYDVFLERLCASTSALSIGDPADPAVGFGPVIDEAAATAILAHIELGKTEARLALAMELPQAARLAPGRAYVAPHIFAEVPPDARLARAAIFGPVLSVMRAASFAEAVALASDTGRLAGGVYSRKPANIELARDEFRVGNLSINRPITDALVGRQPFGGGGLSGTGVKAGGPDSLLEFVEPRTVCENTMRRGFAPEL